MTEQVAHEGAPITWVEVSAPKMLPANPLVSVHMVTYNHEPYIAEAIEGVIAQKADFPIELIIGEDCSTDNTRAIVLEYQQRYPLLLRVLLPSRNVGAQANFEEVARACRGKYVATCEGDDYWLSPSKLQAQVDILESNPNVSAVFGAYAICRRRSDRKGWHCDMHRPVPYNIAVHELRGDIYGQCLAHQGELKLLTAMFRKDVMDALYRKGIPFEEFKFTDSMLLLQAAAMGEIERLDDVVAAYRLSPNSATRSAPLSQLQFLKSARKFFLNIGAYYPERAVLPSWDFARMDIGICRAAFVACEAGEFREAYRRIKESGAVIPLSIKVANVLTISPITMRLAVMLRRGTLAIFTFAGWVFKCVMSQL